MEASSTTSKETHTLVIITGGTICMQDSPDGLVPTADFVDNCLRPKKDFNDGSSLDPTPAVNEYGNIDYCPTLRPWPRTVNGSQSKYSVLEFSDLIDSSSMDGHHWNQIAKCIQENWKSFDAFVLLHGTDTLAYTASALAFMLGYPLEKTVVITGSQLSMYAPNTDANDNLLDSLMRAAEYSGPEVSVVFHHALWRGSRITKVSAFSLAGFTTPNSKPLADFRETGDGSWDAMVHLGTITPANQERSNLQTVNSTISPTLNLDTNRVAVLKVYPGIASAWVDGILRSPGLGGVVIETYGAGNIPMASTGSNLLNILARAVHRGIVVVSVTQCLTGSVTSAYESARKMERRGILAGLDMTTEAAYTKLAYLLAQRNLSRDQIRHDMMENLRGELTSDGRAIHPISRQSVPKL